MCMHVLRDQFYKWLDSILSILSTIKFLYGIGNSFSLRLIKGQTTTTTNKYSSVRVRLPTYIWNSKLSQCVCECSCLWRHRRRYCTPHIRSSSLFHARFNGSDRWWSILMLVMAAKYSIYKSYCYENVMVFSLQWNISSSS